jgi:carbon-monoxide dehydrogenase small subunit
MPRHARATPARISESRARPRPGRIVTAPVVRARVRLTVNGRAVEHEVSCRRSLAEFLREDLGLTGTHVGCEHGVCGACTVLVDGASARSCLLFAIQLEGASVTTIEGLTPPDGLSALQDAFRECHALQCGFCTPGMLVASHELLRDVPRPSEEAIRTALSGNLCMCTGYVNIVRAVLHAAARASAGEQGRVVRRAGDGRPAAPSGNPPPGPDR